MRDGAIEQHPPLVEQWSRAGVLRTQPTLVSARANEHFVGRFAQPAGHGLVNGEAPSILTGERRNELDRERESDGAGQSVERAERRRLPPGFVGRDRRLRGRTQLGQSRLSDPRPRPQQLDRVHGRNISLRIYPWKGAAS
jgi:hypothetical protein